VSYSNTMSYVNLLKSNPDIVLIMLGTEDARSFYWDESGFKQGVKSLVLDCLHLASRPRVFVFQPPPLYKDGVDSMHQHVVNNLEFKDLPEAVANIGSAGSVQYSRAIWDAMGGAALGCAACYFADGHKNDGSHPTSIGFKNIADAVFDTLTAHYILPETLGGHKELPKDGLKPGKPTEPVNTPDSDGFEIDGTLEQQVPIPQELPPDVVQKILSASTKTKHSFIKDAPPLPTKVQGDVVKLGSQSRQVETPENDDREKSTDAAEQALIAQGLPKDLPRDVLSTITSAARELKLGQLQDQPPPSRHKKTEASESKTDELPFVKTLNRVMPTIGAALLPCSAIVYIICHATSKRGVEMVPQTRHW